MFVHIAACRLAFRCNGGSKGFPRESNCSVHPSRRTGAILGTDKEEMTLPNYSEERGLSAAAPMKAFRKQSRLRGRGGAKSGTMHAARPCHGADLGARNWTHSRATCSPPAADRRVQPI